MHRLLVSLLSLLLASFLGPAIYGASAATAAPKIWGNLQPGPYGVGYRANFERDPSRVYFPARDLKGREVQGDRRRPIALRVWYPAVPSTGRPLKYKDYLTLPLPPGPLEKVAAGYDYRTRVVHDAAVDTYAGNSRSLLERLFRSPVAARAGARPAAGRFPIVVFGGGANHSVDENIILWEYLASRGFVVAAVPALGQNTTDFAADAAGLEALARDMEFAISSVRELPFSDGTRVGAAGFSYGGAAALLLAMRNPDVGAVVGLDSSITSQAYNKGLLNSPNYDPMAVKAAVLEIRGDFPDRTPEPDGQVLEALEHSDRLIFPVLGTDHLDYNSYALGLEALIAHEPDIKGRSLSERARLYEAIVRKTAAFFQAHLKDDREAANLLGNPLAAESSVFATAARMAAAPVIPSPTELAHLVTRDGVPATIPLLPPVGERPEDRVQSLITISRTAQQLLQWGYLRQAVDLFRLNAERYPEHSGPLVSLAEACRFGGDYKCAVTTYCAVIRFVDAKGANATPTEAERRSDARLSLKTLQNRPVASVCHAAT